MDVPSFLLHYLAEVKTTDMGKFVILKLRKQTFINILIIVMILIIHLYYHGQQRHVKFLNRVRCRSFSRNRRNTEKCEHSTTYYLKAMISCLCLENCCRALIHSLLHPRPYNHNCTLSLLCVLLFCSELRQDRRV